MSNRTIARRLESELNTAINGANWSKADALCEQIANLYESEGFTLTDSGWAPAEPSELCAA